MEESRQRRRQVGFVGVLGLVVGTVVVATLVSSPFTIPERGGDTDPYISAAYDPPASRVEVILDQGDGQLFAHQAQDPFVRHPEGIRGGPSEQAYRLQRPLYGWLGWVASGGQPGAVAWALIVLTVLSVALLAAVAAAWCGSLGVSPLWGLTVLGAPGVLTDLTRCGPEALACALVGIGLGAWSLDARRVGVAVAAFGAACLLRETIVLVPLTLVLVELWKPHRAVGPSVLRRLVRMPLLLSLVPYLVWVLVLRVGIGAWPRGQVAGRVSVVPFDGLIRAAGSFAASDWFALALLFLPAIIAVVVSRQPGLRALIVAHLGLAGVLGEAVWFDWQDFGRVLMPLTLISLLAVVGRRRPALGATTSRASRAQVAVVSTQ